MGDLLKEAIADAKAVRETALANAKMALEEAFTPQLKNMLSAKLREDEFEDEEEEFGDEMGGGEEEFGAMDVGAGGDEEEIAAGIDGIDGGEEDPFAGGGGEEDPFANGEEEIPAEEPEVEEQIIELNGQSYRLVPLAEDEHEGGEEEFGGEDELDLESIIRELETEINEEELGNGNPDEKDNAYSENGEYNIKEQTDSSDIGQGDNKVDVADGGDEEDPEGGAGVEQKSMDGNGALKSEGITTINGVRYKLVEQEDDEDDDSVEESYDIDSSLFEGDDDDDDDETVDEAVEDKDNAYDEKEDSGQENHGVGTPMGEAKELRQYKEAVRFLKDKLHEVNILNAKLLFTNKLFKEYALDNNQKLKVVETFDRTQSTREIKLVYSTLAEQFGDNGSITNKKSIRESASAKSGSTKPKRKIISEEAQVAARFKKLAGII